jgi:glycosyltransferase involved in cell wall biosynthesis
MPAVLERVPDAKLILAIRRDDKKYEAQLRDLVKELHIADAIEFRLNVSEQEKRELLRSAGLLVVSSVVEGFGIVVLEANALGVPVVASSGVPEGAVRDGFNGLRYEFGDLQALGDAIVRLLQDGELRRTLSENSRVNVQRYRWNRVGAEFEQIVLAATRHHVADVAHD